MGTRFTYNRRYADNKKTAYPGCCCIQCCGSKFGRESKRNKTKTRIRRYYRHAIKSIIQREIAEQIELDAQMEYENNRLAGGINHENQHIVATEN